MNRRGVSAGSSLFSRRNPAHHSGLDLAKAEPRTQHACRVLASINNPFFRGIYGQIQ